MISVVHQFLESVDGFGSAVMPAESRWGFASTPSLQQLQQQHGRQHDIPTDDHSDVQTSYVHQLERDHAFISNHCVAAMAQQLTVSQYTDNLSGTVLAPQLPDAAATDAALRSIREQVDGAWSKEAVWRGVGYAKSGDYEQAMGCYDKALLLNPNNCDAYVARGAAHANQKHFSAALQDFRTALKLDPENVNAAKYMQATEQHAQVAAAAAAEQKGGGAKQTPPSPLAAADRAGVAADSNQHAAAAAAAAEQAGSMQHFDRQQRQQWGHRPYSLERGRHQQQQQQQELRRASRVEDREPQHRNERGRQQQQQQQWQDRQHSYKYSSRSRSPTRKRRRSRSSDGSTSRSGSSSSSSSTSQSDSDVAGADGQGLKRPSIADIQEAIQVLRSEQRHKKRMKKDPHKRGSKKAKRKRKHGSHKHHKSKQKHKSKH